MGRLNFLQSLYAVEVAARLGSLKAAAQELEISSAAVDQQIKELEDYLGSPLLIQQQQFLEPAPALRAILPQLNSSFRSLEKASEYLLSESRRVVSVVADPSWAELWLNPRLERLYRLYPDLEIELVTSTEPGSEPADCEIRFAAADQSGDAALLFHDYLVPVSTPFNLRRIVSLAPARRLEGFPLLQLGTYETDPAALEWPRWIEKFGHRSSGGERGTSYKRAEHALQAMRANAGVLLCGLALAMHQLEQGELEMPFRIEEGGRTSHAYYLFIDRDSAHRPQVGQFRSWLMSEAEQTREKLAEVCGQAFFRSVG